MKKVCMICLAASALLMLSGCAHLEFYDSPREGALTYYDAQPYLFVSVDKDCASTATVVVLPGKQKSVAFKSGYGSNKLSVNLSNGMITSVNQDTDTQIPQTIQALTGAFSTIAKTLPLRAEPPKGCAPSRVLYPIKDGVPDKEHRIPFPDN